MLMVIPIHLKYLRIEGVEINKISGPHPAGNVCVQVHHIDPINKGDVVWYLYPQDVLTIARLFTDGKYDVSRHGCFDWFSS